MKATFLKATAALMVTLVALMAQAAPQGPSFTKMVIQGFLKNNLGTAINGSLTTATITINVDGAPVVNFAANQTIVVSNGAYSHSLTIPASTFYNAASGGTGNITVDVSIPAQALTNSQALSFSLNSSTVPTAFIAENIAPVNTTDTTIGGSIAVGKVVVLGQDGKYPSVSGSNITNISGASIVGSISAATVPASQISSGNFPDGVSVPVTQILSGVLPNGVSLAADQVLSGALPNGVSIAAAQVLSGALPNGVSIGAAQILSGYLPNGVSMTPGVQSLNITGAGVALAADGSDVIQVTITPAANTTIATIAGCNSGVYLQGQEIIVLLVGGAGANSLTFTDTTVASATVDSLVLSAAYATGATANGVARGSSIKLMCTTINGVKKWVEISRSINAT